MSLTFAELNSEDLALMHGLLNLFAEAFDEPNTYTSNRPGDEYLRSLLAATRSSASLPSSVKESWEVWPRTS